MNTEINGGDHLKAIPETTIKEVLLETINNSRKELPFSLTIKDLQELLPFSDTKIYEMIRAGTIPARKIDGKWIIQRDQFLAWFHSNNKDIMEEVKS